MPLPVPKKSTNKRTPQEWFVANCEKIEKFLAKMKTENPKLVDGYSLIRPERDSLIAFLMVGSVDILTLRIQNIDVNAKLDPVYLEMKRLKIVKF